MRALSLRNRLRERFGEQIAFNYRSTPKRNAVPGSDSNASSRKGLYATTEYSPRGIRTGGWQLYPQDGAPRSDPGPREGVLERRSVPPPEERKYYSKIAPTSDADEDSDDEDSDDDDDDYHGDSPESNEGDNTSENNNEDDASDSDEEGSMPESKKEDDASDDDDEEGDMT